MEPVQLFKEEGDLAEINDRVQRRARRRSSFEASLDLIAALATGDHVPTHLMYKTNLSWSILKKLIGELVEKGYVKQISEEARTRYFLTMKGMQLLQLYKSVGDLRASNSDAPN